VAILSGFAPWIVYWVLVGNVPFGVAALAALAVAVASATVSRIRGAAWRTLEVGALATFVVLAVLTFTLSEAFLERWIQPLSTAAILVVALAGVLAGRPFVRELAEADQAPEVRKSDLFGPITARITWIWVGAFAAMTVSAAVPPIVSGNAGILDAGTPLSYLCSWVVPFVVFGAAAVASRALTDQLIAEATSPHTVRKTTFVAFKELEIDQLYYLAREKADREAGAEMEAYDVKLGSQGVPLTGDESRESWPASYKLRPRRH
jgi:hypothetical protein